MIKLALFDLDGLTANTLDTSYKAWNLAIATYKRGAKMSPALYKSITGKGSNHTATTIVSRFGLETTPKQFLREKGAHYMQLLPQVQAMPGVIGYIDYIKEHAEVGLVSNSVRKEVKLILKSLDISKKFKHTIAGDEICCLKPSPDLYEIILSKYKKEPCEAVAFEDSETGIAAAHSARVISVAVPNKHTRTHDFRDADHVAKAWNELSIKFLNKLQRKHYAKHIQMQKM